MAIVAWPNVPTLQSMVSLALLHSLVKTPVLLLVSMQCASVGVP